MRTKRLAMILVAAMVVAACGGDAEESATTVEETTPGADGTPTTAAPTTAGEATTTSTGETTSPTNGDGELPEGLAGLEEMTIVVNQSAGGGADTATRMLEPAIEEIFGLDVLVENITEAGGVTGTNEVFNAEPDGSVVGALLIPRTIQQEVLLDTQYQTSELAHVLLFRFGSFALTVSADSPYEDFQAMVEASQEEPIPVGVTGPGSATDLQAAVLADVAGAEFVRVPFDGEADIRTALLGNNIPAGMLPLNATALEEGYRILVVPTDEEFGPYPELPTLGDFDLPSADVSFYQGIFGPSGMSDEVKAGVEEVFRAALEHPDVQQQFEAAGYFPTLLAGEEMTSLIQEQRGIIDQYIDLLEEG